jgi:hypothetical protein
MNINWKKISAAGGIIAGIAVVHGTKTRTWRYIHTGGVVLGIIAAAAPYIIKRKSAQSASPDLSARSLTVQVPCHP